MADSPEILTFSMKYPQKNFHVFFSKGRAQKENTPSHIKFAKDMQKSFGFLIIKSRNPH